MRTGLWGWKTLMLAVLAAVVVTLSVTSVRGQDTSRAEAVLTVLVSSADHEAREGYFTLGDKATVMVKPGSDLYNFLAGQRGRKIRITLTEASGADLSRLERLSR